MPFKCGRCFPHTIGASIASSPIFNWYERGVSKGRWTWNSCTWPPTISWVSKKSESWVRRKLERLRYGKFPFTKKYQNLYSRAHYYSRSWSMRVYMQTVMKITQPVTQRMLTWKRLEKQSQLLQYKRKSESCEVSDIRGETSEELVRFKQKKVSFALSRANEIPPRFSPCFNIIVKIKWATFFYGLHSHRPQNEAIKCLIALLEVPLEFWTL